MIATQELAPPPQPAELNDMASGIANLIVHMVLVLVDSPEQVTVTVIPDDRETTFRLKAADSDVGKVIGKQGRTARALRTILSAASMKSKHRFTLDIVNPAAGRA